MDPKVGNQKHPRVCNFLEASLRLQKYKAVQKKPTEGKQKKG